jgi:hypothetical protein
MMMTTTCSWEMRELRRRMARNVYMVEAQLIPGFEADLLQALEAGEVAPGKYYQQEMQQALCQARLDGRTVRWIEACHCASPLAAERQDLDQFFIIRRVQVLGADQPQPDLSGEPILDALRAIVAAAPKFAPYKSRA